VLSISPGNREYLEAVSRGEAQGLAVLNGGTLVHYAFLMYANKTACLLGFGRRVGLIGNAFTVPSYRGRGCQSRSAAARIGMAREAGLEQVISETRYDNIASQKNLPRAGMTLLGKLEVVVLLNMLVIRYRRPAGSISLWGICA
jgi:RimJ/RimL family protein N-acetyltransferase